MRMDKAQAQAQAQTPGTAHLHAYFI